MNEYSKKILKVPTMTFVREQDQGKQPVLDVRNLGIDFGGLTAVDSFNITIGPTEISGLIGPNGAGKTTIFNLLTGVYQPTEAPCWSTASTSRECRYTRSTSWASPGRSRTSACFRI